MLKSVLSRTETRILEQFWKLGTSSVREILESLPEEERVAYTTVQTLVHRLEQKGAVRRVKRIGNAQLFEPAIDQTQFRSGLVHDCSTCSAVHPACWSRICSKPVPLRSKT